MKRPIIKGTPFHKASIAKAKSIVSQSRTRTDSSLINAGDDLGKSYSLKDQDYKLKSYDLSNIPEKEKKVLTPEEQAAKDAKKLARKAKRKEIGNKLVDGVKTVVGGVAMIPIAIGKGLFKLGDEIVNEFGDIVKDIKDKGVEGKERRKIADEKRVANNLLKKQEREFNTADAVRIRAEKKAKKEKEKAEADKLKQEELDKKEIEKALALERKNEEKALALERKNEEKLKKEKHKAKVKELKGYQKEKDAADEEAQRLKDIQMNKKAVITVDKPVVNAFGDEQVSQYTKEQRERLKTEGVWSESEEKMVLPEEIVDGEFVSKAEGTKIEILESDNFSNDNQTNKEVVEEKDTSTDNNVEDTDVTKIPPKPRMSDFEGNFLEKAEQYKKAMKVYKEKYDTKYGKSPVEMRDDRIYQFANKNGPVRKNMIKGGYKPQ